MKTIRSKYLGVTFDNGWTCTHVGIATVQDSSAKYPYHRGYYYIFERPTSDGKATKMIRLNSAYAAKVWSGRMQVETYSKRYGAKHSEKFTQKVTYRNNH